MTEQTLPDYRIRYNRNLKEPNKLIVWDFKNNEEYNTDHFDMTDCTIRMQYENSIKQEKACGSKVILLVWKND